MALTIEPGKVLVVDDDPLSRRLIADLLSRDGYDLAFASDGSAALMEATRKVPDVILLDVMMPQMDGFEVCRHLRLDPLLAEVSIIMITSLADRASHLRGLDAGADDFITKPVDGIELKTRVRNVFQLNRYRKLLQERTKAQLAQAEVISSCEDTLAAWVRILERDGRLVPGRCDRVTRRALRLAKIAGMAESDLVALRWSLLLEAIAAMTMPAALRGHAYLSPEEDELVRQQEAWIIEALTPVLALRKALDFLAARHEHWDGSGRPGKLKGAAIPLAARVLAVALAWETDQFPEPSTIAARLALLKAQAGQRFEPRLIEALAQVVTDRQDSSRPPVISTPAGVAAPAEFQQRPGALHLLSLSAQGTRAQFAVALALISIIPLLIMIYLCLTGWLGIQATLDQLWPVLLMVLPFLALGYWMLAKYPVNVVRLRRYLNNLAQGTSPGHVALVKDEDDMAAIEMLLRKVVRQADERVHTIQSQTEALLEAERQRVMIQSLGTACHHLGQPATVIIAYLDMTRRLQLPPQAQAMLGECRTAAAAVQDILAKLQHLTVYHTEPYLEQNGRITDAGASSRIIKV